MSTWLTAKLGIACELGTLIDVLTGDKAVMKDWMKSVEGSGRSWKEFMKVSEAGDIMVGGGGVGQKGCSISFEGYGRPIGFYKEGGEWKMVGDSDYVRNRGGLNIANVAAARIKQRKIAQIQAMIGGQMKQAEVGTKIIMTIEDIDDATWQRIQGSVGGTKQEA